MNCDECGEAKPLYYADTTNHHYACFECWTELVDGTRLPRPHTERSMSQTENALARTFDFATAHTDATKAREGTTQMQSSFMVPITTPELAEWATSTAKNVRTYKQQLEAQRDSGVKPLLDVVETIRSWFRDPIAGCEAVYTHLTSGVASFLASERAKQAAALREATSQTEVAAAVTALAPKPVGASERTYWHAEVTTPPAVTMAAIAALRERMRAHCAARYESDEELRVMFAEWHTLLGSAIPGDYLGVDMTRLNREARERKEAFNVPGAKAVPETKVVPL